MLWTVVFRGSKTIDLLSRKLTSSLAGFFFKDCKDCNKKFNEWTKEAETLKSETAQVTATFSGTNDGDILLHEHHKRHIGIFFYSQKPLSLLHAQIDDKCPDSSHSGLIEWWIENHNAIFVFKELYPAVVDFLDELTESRDG